MLKKKLSKVLETIETDSSIKAIFADVSKRKGMDTKKLMNVCILLLEELETLQEKVEELSMKKK